MKLLILSVSCLFIAGLLLTCRHADVEPDPLLDGTPRLKSISFSGIPQDNISIDQKAKLILVQMPAIILDKVAVSLDLTENAEWIEGNTKYILPNLFGCESCFQIILKDKQGVLDQTVYTVKTTSTAQIQVALLSQPISYTIRGAQEAIDIPMINLYGNELPKEAHLIYDDTNEEIIIKRAPFYSDQGIQYSGNANRLGIYLYNQKLLPGSYHLTFLMDNNLPLKVSQPLIITKGAININYNTLFGYQVPIGKSFTVEGYNLFEGDISFDLIDKQDKILSLSGLIFEPYGQQLQVQIPAVLQSGQYVLRVYIKGVKQLYCLRVNILKDDKDRPILGTLVTGNDGSPCSLLEPVIAQRGIDLFFTSNQEKPALDKLSQHVSLQLTSVTNGISYVASVVPYNMIINPSFPGSFTIPNTVPPGLYTAILQVLDAQNNVINESDPYGRNLKVQ